MIIIYVLFGHVIDPTIVTLNLLVAGDGNLAWDSEYKKSLAGTPGRGRDTLDSILFQRAGP